MVHFSKFPKDWKPSTIEYKKGKTKHQDVSTIFCFDCETTSIWNIDNHITSYDEKYTDEQFNNAEQKAFIYVWMLSVDDIVYYGRFPEEIPQFLQTIRKQIPEQFEHPIIYIHNLSFDMQFLQDYLTFTDVFARSVRKPMKAIANGFEFRCSYLLTGLSLASWGSSIGVNKKVGDLDYNILRTPITKLTETELTYCEFDCLVMYHGLKKYQQKYITLSNIPLTSTGEVRKVLKDNTDMPQYKINTSLLPRNATEYSLQKNIFHGGATGSCYTNTGVVLYHVGSYDLTSDYPSQMVLEKYPSSNFIQISTTEKWNLNEYCYIICFSAKNIRSKTDVRYLSTSWCNSLKKYTSDNGKLIAADEAIITCTDVDYKLIKQTYKYTETRLFVFKARKSYLPKSLIETILTFYENKTKLKGVDQFEEPALYDLFMQSKKNLNSLYGCSCTDLINQEIVFNSGDWKNEYREMTNQERIDFINETLEELHEKPWKNVLVYTTGVWVTAYARARLFSVLLPISKNNDLVYYDTDSCKMLHPEKYKKLFEGQNRTITQKCEKALKHHGIDISRGCPKTQKGVSKQLGVWDSENHTVKNADGTTSEYCYYSFITQGAKRYAYQTEPNSAIHCTVSGVPKSNSIAIKSLEDFKHGFVFPRDLKDENGRYIAKKLHTYIDDSNWCPVLPDGYTPTNKHSTTLRNTSYNMTLANDYLNLIELGRGKRFWD